MKGYRDKKGRNLKNEVRSVTTKNTCLKRGSHLKNIGYILFT